MNNEGARPGEIRNSGSKGDKKQGAGGGAGGNVGHVSIGPHAFGTGTT